MKTHEETKNLLAAWGTGVLIECGDGTCRPPGIWQGTAAEVCRDALELIQQLETSYSQVSKALCGKENASLEEVLQEVSQVKSRLAQAERERDALIRFIQKESFPAVISAIPEACQWCKNHDGNFTKDVCKFCGTHDVYGNFEWRGVCPENTKGGRT